MTKYQLPEMPYDFGALEPAIAGDIMELHYNKHHNGYVTKLNDALDKYQDLQSKGELEKAIPVLQAKTPPPIKCARWSAGNRSPFGEPGGLLIFRPYRTQTYVFLFDLVPILLNSCINLYSSSQIDQGQVSPSLTDMIPAPEIGFIWECLHNVTYRTRYSDLLSQVCSATAYYLSFGGGVFAAASTPVWMCRNRFNEAGT